LVLTNVRSEKSGFKAARKLSARYKKRFPHPEEARSAASKDAPRRASPFETRVSRAPQDEG
jgi:hypothetical protein